MNDFETIEYILKSGCSIARFGDGELDFMIGMDLYFQDATPEIQRKLREVAQQPDEDALNYKSKMVDSCDEQEMINYERKIICRITQE